MKLRITFLLFIVLLVQLRCSSVQSTTTTSSVRDASSFENAVIVNSISEEYEWVREHHPDSRMQMQALVFQGKKPFDVLTFTMPDGSSRKFYFDISKFYGKGF